MLFPTLFLNSFDKAAVYTEQHVHSHRDVAIHLKKLLTLEEEHAKGLIRIAKSLSDAQQQSHQLHQQHLPDGGGNNSGNNSNHQSLHLAILAFAGAIESQARSHGDSIARAQATIADVLLKQQADLEATRKATKQAHDTAHKSLSAAAKEEQKLRGKYDSSQAEWEQLTLQIDRECNTGKKSSNLTKLYDKETTVRKKLSQYKDEERVAVASFNEQQSNLYKRDLPVLLTRLEETVIKSSETAKAAIAAYNTLAFDFAKETIAKKNDLDKLSDRIDPTNDIKHFCATYGNPQSQVPKDLEFHELETSKPVLDAIQASKPMNSRSTTIVDFNAAAADEKDPSPAAPSSNTLFSRTLPRPTASVASAATTESSLSLPTTPSASSSRSLSRGFVLSQQPPPPEEPTRPAAAQSSIVAKKAVALYDCVSNAADEVSFTKGESLEILKSQGDWWLVRNSKGQMGKAPSNYVRLIGAASSPSTGGSEDSQGSSESADMPKRPPRPVVPSRSYEPVQPPQSQSQTLKRPSIPQRTFSSAAADSSPQPNAPRPSQFYVDDQFSAKSPAPPAIQCSIVMDNTVPLLVRRCIEYLVIKDAVALEGIFRVPGSQQLMNQLKRDFEKGIDVNLMDTCHDPMAVAGLLKLFYRESKDSPITPAFRDASINSTQVSSKHERALILHQAIIQLEPRYRSQLTAVFELLLKVVEREQENKMNASNIGRVFGLSLFQEYNVTTAIGLMEFMILQFDAVFKGQFDPSKIGEDEQAVHVDGVFDEVW